MKTDRSLNSLLKPVAHFFQRAFLKSEVLIALLILSSNIVFAQPIGNWTFNNILTGTVGTHNTVSIADFSAAVPTHSFNGGTEYFGENGWPTGAINTADYMEFSLTPNAGYQLDISSIVLVMRRSNTGSPSGSGPTSWSIRSSLDGYTANIASGTMTHNYATYTITPGSGFLNLYTTTTFRLYGYNVTTGTGGISRLVVDNITVNGLGYLLASELKSFTAIGQEQSVALKFSLYNTQASEQYQLERSTDGSHFTTIHSIEERDDYTEKAYSYTDNNMPAGITTLFYRLHIHAANSHDRYSAIAVVALQKNNTGHLLQTFIRQNNLYINGVFSNAGTYQLVIYTISGHLLMQTSITTANGYQSLVIPVNIHATEACVISLSNSSTRFTSVVVPLQ
jgi:hypothetical protein